MSATAIVSVEDYLRRTEKPYCEYVDGVLYPKAMPTKLHALVQYMLTGFSVRQGVEALAEVTCPPQPNQIPHPRRDRRT